MCALLLFQSIETQAASESRLVGFRRGLATVMFAGLGGAILGLSTLSFYGEPEDHIGNIWTGLSIGVLAGGAYVISRPHASAAAALEYVPPRQISRRGSPVLFQYAWEF